MAYLILLIAAATALVTGILGTLLMCIKHRCYTVLFGSLLTIVWLVATIFGLVLVGLNMTSVEVLEAFCTKDVSGEGFTGTLQTFVKNAIDDVDASMASVVNKQMCSEVCPCDTTTTTKWFAKTAEELKPYGRSPP